MDFRIIAFSLLVSTLYINPNQCYQLEDVTLKTVTSRPIFFGTVQAEEPSSTLTPPFKPSKQLFDRIFIPGTTQQPPDGSEAVLEPKSARLDSSEAMHINMYTLPSDSLDYNFLLGKQEAGGDNVDLQTPAEEQLVKKEVHYHHHKHYHGHSFEYGDGTNRRKKKEEHSQERKGSPGVSVAHLGLEEKGYLGEDIEDQEDLEPDVEVEPYRRKKNPQRNEGDGLSGKHSRKRSRRNRGKKRNLESSVEEDSSPKKQRRRRQNKRRIQQPKIIVRTYQ